MGGLIWATERGFRSRRVRRSDEQDVADCPAYGPPPPVLHLWEWVEMRAWRLFAWECFGVYVVYRLCGADKGEGGDVARKIEEVGRTHCRGSSS